MAIGVQVNKVAVLEVANEITSSSSTSLWALQDPLITAVAAPPISIHYTIIDSAAGMREVSFPADSIIDRLWRPALCLWILHGLVIYGEETEGAPAAR